MEPGAEPDTKRKKKPEDMHGKSGIRGRKPGVRSLIKNMNFVMPHGN